MPPGMVQAWGGSLWDVTGSVSCVCSQEVCKGVVARARDLERVMQTGQRLAELLTSKWTQPRHSVGQPPQARSAEGSYFGAHQKAYP